MFCNVPPPGGKRSVIQNYYCERVLTRVEEFIAREEPEIRDKDLKKCLDIVKQSGTSDAHSFQRANGNLILFRRERSGYCSICNRIHDNDNTLMVIVKENKIIEHCRHSENGKIRVLGNMEKSVTKQQQIRKIIQKKLVVYKRQDTAKKLQFNLKVDHVLELKNAQSNLCAACNIELLWIYKPRDTQQFSVDRIDNTKGHTHDNVRLTCLECNRKRGYAVLNV